MEYQHPYKHYGSYCDKPSRCAHCGHCRNCGGYIMLPSYPWPVYGTWPQPFAFPSSIGALTGGGTFSNAIGTPTGPNQ